MNRSRVLNLLLLCPLVGLLFSGAMCICAPETPSGDNDQQNLDETTWEELLGGDDERLIFRRVENGSEHYVAWDVAGGQATELHFPQTPCCNGKWAAWGPSMTWSNASRVVSRSPGKKAITPDNLLHALDLNTGRELEFSAEVGSMNQPFSLWSVHGSRLFGFVSEGGERGFRTILDLATGEWQVLLDTLARSDVAIDGDWLALWYYPSPAADPSSPLVAVDDPALLAAYQTNLDAVNLVTGERISILRGIAGTSIFPLTVVGNRVIWNASPRDSSGTSTDVVWSYELDSGKTEKLLETNPANWNYVLAIGQSGILVVQIVWDTSETRTTTYSMHRFDGQAYTVLVVPPGVGDGSEMPRFAGNLLVYRDPVTNAWTIFDPATGTSRAINPFGT